MAQQLNLLDPRFLPQPLRGSARHGLVAVAGALLLALAGAQGLHWAAGQARRAADEATRAQAPLRAQLMAGAASAGSSAELAQLRALDAGQRRIRAALDAGIAGSREGPSDYLVALARQASPSVWITGFAVAEGGAAVDLEGRMADPSALADYLRKLNAEPRFRGRPFAQLSLKAVDHESQPLPYTEFALRSAAPTAGATAP